MKPVIAQENGYTHIRSLKSLKWGNTANTQTIRSTQVPKMVTRVGAIDLPMPRIADAATS